MTDFSRLPDLASRSLGGAVVAANDEFFAAKENLVLPEPAAERIEFGHRGKEYVEKLPAETALGNPDPAGGSEEDPKAFDESGPRGSEA